MTPALDTLGFQPLDSEDVFFFSSSAWLGFVSLPVNTMTTLSVDPCNPFIRPFYGFLVTVTSSRAEELLTPKEEEVWKERHPMVVQQK